MGPGVGCDRSLGEGMGSPRGRDGGRGEDFRGREGFWNRRPVLRVPGITEGHVGSRGRTSDLSVGTIPLLPLKGVPMVETEDS